MLARKPKKFSLNTSESSSMRLHKEGSNSPSLNLQRKKSAADAATSILEELGVKKLSSAELDKKILGENVKRKVEQKKEPTVDLEDWERRILKDLEVQKPKKNKIKTKKSGIKKTELKKTKLKNAKSGKPAEMPKLKFGFHEKFVLLAMFCVIGTAALAIIGGHLKLLDSAVFYQLTGGNVHQVEFVSEFEARYVENGYNRLPLFVVEGSIRNTFAESDQVKKIQLKAFAFDADQRLIASHFAYAGAVLSDDQLERLSPMNIKALRHSGDLEMLNSFDPTEPENRAFDTDFQQDQEIPFQVVFFKSVSNIKRTSLQIVSYVRNNQIVYVRAPDLK